MYSAVISLLPQDMEALKRSLALIESKMGEAKRWLKDPHGQPGKRIFSFALSAEPIRFLNVVDQRDPAGCFHPQETLARLPCV